MKHESVTVAVGTVAWMLLTAGCAKAPAEPAPTQPAEALEVEVAIPAGQNQIIRRADSMKWGPCPPVLPNGCEMAVLEGSPKEEILFTARFRTTIPFELKPHSHPRNERVTILEGKIGVGFGDAMNRKAVTWFGPGDYYVNAKGAHHFVVADGPALLQITGIGPWKMNFLDAE
jgi:hypothetical protein